MRKLATADLAAGLPVYRTSVIVFGRICRSRSMRSLTPTLALPGLVTLLSDEYSGWC